MPHRVRCPNCQTEFEPSTFAPLPPDTEVTFCLRDTGEQVTVSGGGMAPCPQCDCPLPPEVG